MKRKLMAVVFCLLHLAFIILPEVQLWPYLNAIADHLPQNEAVVSGGHKIPLTGDITYLKALVERSKKMEDTKRQHKIPETSVSHTGLIYLPSDEINHNLFYRENTILYTDISESLVSGTPELLSPPPKVTFC
ncbi:MAG: hypothetical protein KUL83_10800 [Lentimicrobium sp.]|jgi:hypothetical protein|nr:hypothetical protein [Lentimicrobium sp.]MDD2527078.1 hypothetical protein [Lentimicrobiaceae bacterium]MDD4598486.1 hypothetical protein [Lentimicrobiaceae bacterium]MDY0026288.1 hypothetical protein [Lentimicrobium sp.]HAH57540.1 hypothetical protein [Bacteroidales bacterium]